MFLIYGVLAVFLISISNLIILSPGIFTIEKKIIQYGVFVFLQFIISFLIYNYYIKGYAFNISYSTLIIIFYGIGILASVFISKIILQDVIDIYSIAGSFLIVIGLSIILLNRAKII